MRDPLWMQGNDLDDEDEETTWTEEDEAERQWEIANDR